jgi:hypothetical protein
MNEQEKQIAYESIARELKKTYPAECAAVTPETVAAIQRWVSAPDTLTTAEEMVRELLRADNLLQSPQTAAELLHRAERAEL